MVLSMDKWVGKVAIVTGTSSGIGNAVAIQLVDAGLLVVGVARRKERGDEMVKQLSDKKGKFYHVTGDVTKEEDVLNAYKWVKDNLGPVHILINNAGVGKCSSLIDGDTREWKETLDTNVLGLCMMTREAVKDMRANNVNGHIVHINSLAGHYVSPGQSLNVYTASKYAVTALTETLRQELNSIGSKIKISSISPGFVDTDIIKSSSIAMYEKYFKINSLKSEDVAAAVLYALLTPPHVQVHDILMKHQ